MAAILGTRSTSPVDVSHDVAIRSFRIDGGLLQETTGTGGQRRGGRAAPLASTRVWARWGWLVVFYGHLRRVRCGWKFGSGAFP
eukprot:365659-Chlamydomonas_euryale.AAC.5